MLATVLNAGIEPASVVTYADTPFCPAAEQLSGGQLPERSHVRERCASGTSKAYPCPAFTETHWVEKQLVANSASRAAKRSGSMR